MASWAPKACLGSFLALATASAAMVVVHYLKKRPNVKLPPVAPISVWNVVGQLTKPSAPLFQLKLGLDLGSPVYQLPLPFGKRLFVVMDAATASTVLKDDDQKPSVSNRLAENTFNGPTLVTIPTTSLRWQKTRRALAHMFAPGALSQKVPLLHEHVNHLIDILDEHCKTQEEVDIVSVLLRFGLDFVGLAAFEYDLQSLKNPVHSDGALFLKELRLALDEFALRRLTNPFRRLMFWDADVQRANLSVRQLHSLSFKILNHFRQTHSADQIQSSQTIGAEILRNPQYPDDAARASEVTLFLMGGHDSTSNSLAWMLYDLARHPEVAKEVYAELDAATVNEKQLTATQLSRLRILDACIRESMRLWPVFGRGFFRQITKDTEYKDMVIPAESVVMVPFYGTGRWPEGIDGPEEYRPHRWLGPAEEVEALEERFVMFAKGRRNCIGQNLARLEMRLVLSRLLQCFEFEVTQEPTYHHSGTTKPLNLKLRVRHRV